MKLEKILAAFALVHMTATGVRAQDIEDGGSENGFHFSSEFVTEDVWRGGFAGSAAFEPEISYTIGGFSIGTWASSPLNYGNDTYNELDFFIEYAVGGVTLTFSDYCWTNGNDKFEYFGPYKENHLLEASLGYDFGVGNENVPLSFSVNTIVAGANRKANGDQGFSTYLEAVYAPSLKKLDMSLTVGAAIENEEAAMYSKKGGFNFVNIDFGLSHDFKLRDVATLTLGANLICNPTGFEEHGEAYVTGSIGISF